ncbi:MAG TPA: hypothetical protein VHS78_06830 [Candidatus Elarobacter sp.]|nr:hypothetical protein [Candidatus Elarobacter sp.]
MPAKSGAPKAQAAPSTPRQRDCSKKRIGKNDALFHVRNGDEMTDWRALIFDTLRDLGADQRLIPGSRLMQELARRSSGEDTDFRVHLKNVGLSFSKFLSQFRPEIIVDIRGARDMLVGLPGATEGPPLTEPRQLREDVYKAFTRVEAQPYNYSRSHNLFTQEQLPAEDVVPGPTITTELLIEERKEFAQTQPSDVSTDLMAALDDPAPLTAYLHALGKRRLQRPWRRFRLAKLADRVAAWAEASGLPLHPEWFNEAGPLTATPARRVIDLILAEMTDDEVRSLLVPVRAVEVVIRKASASVPRD